MTIEIYQRSTVEGQAVSTWVRPFVEALCNRMPIRYVNAWLDAEYDAKNMVRENGGIWAVGADPLEEIACLNKRERGAAGADAQRPVGPGWLGGGRTGRGGCHGPVLLPLAARRKEGGADAAGVGPSTGH